MAGNAASGAAMRETMIKRFGSVEAWKAHMAEVGRIGGKKIPKTPRGFAANRERARIAGAKGGRISRIPKKTEN